MTKLPKTTKNAELSYPVRMTASGHDIDMLFKAFVPNAQNINAQKSAVYVRGTERYY